SKSPLQAATRQDVKDNHTTGSGMEVGVEPEPATGDGGVGVQPEPAAARPLPEPLPPIVTRPIAVRVAVLTDWKRCSRGVFWEDLLERLVVAPNLCTLYPL